MDHNSNTTMKQLLQIIILSLLILAPVIHAQNQIIQDDFEGNGNIQTWFGDDCNFDTSFSNPYPQGINTSATVLKYDDIGGQYSNVGFDISNPLDLSNAALFTLKVYVPSAGISGTQPNQVSLKLQDGTLASPWSTQCEIIKPILLDQWQTLSFDFLNDSYINLDPNSPPPTQRNDFNRVLIQLNGENNFDLVLAYIDDFLFIDTAQAGPVFDYLVWSDEFQGSGAIDNTKWFHQTIFPLGTSWYNGEIQSYTNRLDNSNLSNGILNIIGKKESYTSQGVTKQYTSARLNSKFAFKYGRVEVRAKLPSGVGTWPAIWTLGKNIDEDNSWWDLQGYGTTPWPACGEIDIMEHWGINQNYVQSATHTPSSFGGTVNHGGQTIPTASTDFHTYSLDWFPDKLVFAVDGITHYIYQPMEYNSNTWPFDEEQFLLLNFAFLPDIAPSFISDTLAVDYVRIYQTQSAETNIAGDNTALYELRNAPNPATDHTIISYSLPESTRVNLNIYDLNGRLIQELVDEHQSKGQYAVFWKPDGINQGLYLYTLQTKDAVISGKCIVSQ